MVDSVASDGEKRVHEAMVALDKAVATVAAHDAAFMAPRVPYEPATISQIAEAQKASREASPRYKAHANAAVRRQRVNYRNYVIHYDQKPVPGHEDWSFSHEDFDGAPDGPGTSCSDHRCGYAVTPKDAKAQIDAQYEDLGLDEDGHYK